MRLLPPQRLCALASDPACRTRTVEIEAIDFSRPFIHEDYTQLYYTPLYARLSDEQRLVYNQLFAVRTNEFIMMLEDDFVAHILVPLRRHPRLAARPELLQCLDILIAEEGEHYQLFTDINRRSFPDLFHGGRERFFSRLPWHATLTFHLLGMLIRRLAFPLWYFMAMEESSITLARAMTSMPDTETLGRLEPHWVAVHREHAKDEARHLHIDAHLIERCIGRAGGLTRRTDAALFQRLLRGGVTRPERSGSGVRVIRELVRRRPELRASEQDLISAVLKLKDHNAFQRSLFNRHIMPLTFGIFDATPELTNLSRHMVGYERQ
jgi:hypothetical protein